MLRIAGRSGVGIEPAASVGEIVLVVGRISFHHRDHLGGEDLEEARQRQPRHLGSTGRRDGSGAKKGESARPERNWTLVSICASAPATHT
jgi:hypothetical protein